MDANQLKKCQDALYAYLDTKSLNHLRAYGREVGVDVPCGRKKDDLIWQIVKILTGEIAPIDISSRGAPVKNDYFPPEMVAGTQDILKRYMFLEEKGVEKQTKTFGSLGAVLPLDCFNGKKIVIPEDMAKENALRVGDVVGCLAKQGEKALVATRILTVNNMMALSLERIRFEEGTVCYPKENVSFVSGTDNGLTEKYFDWAFPIGKGQRACVFAPPKTGKTILLQTLARAANKSEEKLCVLGLLVDGSPESATAFRSALPAGNVVCTTYEDDAERQVFAAEFLLKRAKRYVELGQDVLLIVDSFSSLARAYNDTDFSSGGKVLSGGLESKTLQYLKRFLGSARRLEEGGSLTILGAVSTQTGNPADDLICSELSTVANWEVFLDTELAKRRVFPAIQPSKNRCVGVGIGGGDTCVIDAINDVDAETTLRALAESETKAAFVENLKK